jgi:dynein heavy chain, axonemal
VYALPADTCAWTKLETGGEVPPGRWRHSAVADGNKLFVFGGFHSSHVRLNDLYVLDLKTNTWTQQGNPAAAKERRKKKQGGDATGPAGPVSSSLAAAGGAKVGGAAAPVGDAYGMEHDITVIPVAANSTPEAPSPRGGHGAAIIGRNMWVFGGYGGAGYQRTDFNDLYSFDIDTMSWNPLIEVHGTLPGRRSGHSLFAVRTNLMVYGGWNSSESFDDLFLFDTVTNVWSQVEGGSYGVPRWSHCGVAIEAVPNWQVVVFGGSVKKSEGDPASARSQGVYSNDLLLLDTGRMRWSPLEGDGASPSARADASMVYDREQKRLIVFGGFSGKWFNDCSVLNVARCVLCCITMCRSG